MSKNLLIFASCSSTCLLYRNKVNVLKSSRAPTLLHRRWKGGNISLLALPILVGGPGSTFLDLVITKTDPTNKFPSSLHSHVSRWKGCHTVGICSLTSPLSFFFFFASYPIQIILQLSTVHFSCVLIYSSVEIHWVTHHSILVVSVVMWLLDKHCFVHWLFTIPFFFLCDQHSRNFVIYGQFRIPFFSLNWYLLLITHRVVRAKTLATARAKNIAK